MGTTLEALIRAKVRDIKTRDLFLEILDTVKGHDHNGANSKFVAVEGTVGDGAITNDKLNSTVKMGLLANLTTTDKANMVAALNEVRAALLTGEITLTNKTLTTPVIPAIYQDVSKSKLMSLPDTASDTLTANEAAQTLSNKILTEPKIYDGHQHLTLKSADQTHALAKLNVRDFTLENEYIVLEKLAQTLENKTLVAPKIDSAGEDCVLSSDEQTIGEGTANIPNLAGNTDEFTMIALTQTLTNKTLTTPKISNAGENCIVTADQQTTGAGTAAIPNLDGESDKFVMTDLEQELSNKTLEAPKLLDPLIDDGNDGITIAAEEQTNSSAVITIPDIDGASDEFVAKDLEQTLTNKTLTSPVVNDPNVLFGAAEHDFNDTDDWELTSDEEKKFILYGFGAAGDVDAIATPTANKIYVVRNGTGNNLTVKPSDNDGVTLEDGETCFIMGTGTDFIKIMAVDGD